MTKRTEDTKDFALLRNSFDDGKRSIVDEEGDNTEKQSGDGPVAAGPSIDSSSSTFAVSNTSPNVTSPTNLAQIYGTVEQTLLPAPSDGQAIEQQYKEVPNFPDEATFKQHLANAYNQLGNTLYNKTHYDQAIEKYKEALKLFPDDATFKQHLANAHNQLGHTLYNKTHYGQAIEQYEKALNLYPDDATFKQYLANAHNQLGHTLYNKTYYDQAIEKYKKELNLCPDDATLKQHLANAHNQLGTILFNEQNYNQAIEKYKEALNLCPDDTTLKQHLANAYNALGNNLFQLQSYDQAIEKYKEALNLCPDNAIFTQHLANAHIKLGHTLYKKQNYDQAIKQFEEAHKLNSYNTLCEDFIVNTYIMIGIEFYKKNNYEEAIANCNRALAFDHAGKGWRDEANDLKDVLEDLKTNLQSFNNAINQYSGASQDLFMALAQSCNNVAETYIKLGNIFFGNQRENVTQQYNAAIGCYKTAIAKCKTTLKDNAKEGVSIDRNFIQLYFDAEYILEQFILVIHNNLNSPETYYSHSDRSMLLDEIRNATMQIAADGIKIIKSNPAIKMHVYNIVYCKIGTAYQTLGKTEVHHSSQQQSFFELARKCYAKATQYGEVEKCYMKAILELPAKNVSKIDNTDTESAIAHFTLGQLCERDGRSDRERVIAHYKHSIQSAPKFIDPYLRLAILYSEDDPKEHDKNYLKARSLFAQLDLGVTGLWKVQQDIIFEYCTGKKDYYSVNQRNYYAFMQDTDFLAHSLSHPTEPPLVGDQGEGAYF